jgi:hypothetical protein
LKRHGCFGMEMGVRIEEKENGVVRLEVAEQVVKLRVEFPKRCHL